MSLSDDKFDDLDLSFVLLGIGTALFSLDVVFLWYEGWKPDPTSPVGTGFMGILGAIAACCVLIGTLLFIRRGILPVLKPIGSYIGSFFQFAGKVFLGVWGLAVTAGLGYLIYLHYLGVK